MYRLRSPGKGPSSRSKGQLHLCVQERKENLYVTVNEARSLQLAEKKAPSCYVKLYVLPDENKSTKQKSKVCSGKTAYVFKEQFSYGLPKGERGHFRLYVSLWKRDRASRNELIGSMSFGFKEILDSKTRRYEGWYHLLPDGEGRCQNVPVENEENSSKPEQESATTIPDDSAWLPTKIILLSRSPVGGYGFSVGGSCPVVITKVEDNLPAQLAGILRGDRILQVDDKSVAQAKKEDVLSMIRSCPGSIRLLIQRPLSSSPLSPPPSPPASTTTTTTSSAQAEDLSGSGVGSGYDTLKRRRRRRSSTTGESGGEDDRVATPQKPFRGYISWNEISPLEQNRQEAILELVRWEKRYVASLHFGIERYSKPLRQHMLDQEEHRLMFGNIDQLLRLSTGILKQLKSRRKPFHLREAEHPFYILAVGDIYKAKIGEIGQLYDIYEQGKTQAELELSLRRLQPDFVEFLEEPPLNEGQPTIDEFVMLPLEYLGKLRSLLRRMMANTPTYHPDQHSLLSCVESLAESKIAVTDGVDRDAYEMLRTIEKHLIFLPGVQKIDLCVPGRSLLHSGDLVKVEGKKRKPRKVHALLFTDILLFTRREDGLYVVTDSPVDMTSAMVQDFNSVEPTEFCITVVERSGDEKLATASWKASHQMKAPSLKEKETWRRLIDERAKGVSNIRRKTNLKNFRTMPVVSITSPEEDLRLWEREQQLRLVQKAPQLYVGPATRTAHRNRTRPLSVSSLESLHSVASSAPSSEPSSPTRDRKGGKSLLYRHLSLFDRHPFKSRMQKRRHSFASAAESPLVESRLPPPPPNVTPETIEKWRTSFDALLANQDGLDLFRRFLESEFSEENVLFWTACEEMKQLKRHELEHKAKEIFSKYIALDAPMEVNIDAETRKSVLPFLDNPSYTMFNQAQRAIFHLMERDSYKRFLESEEFHAAEEAAGTKF
ncbi:regulator of G-protein signaling 3-like [Oscarella lobularis]|uniref:regulator of G-protein signaling 3-like n=1 Tax=Oscarella lobularis TaxID=121494 RepID=UPI003313425D